MAEVTGIQDAGNSIANAILGVAQENKRQEEKRGQLLLQSAQKDPALFDDPNVRKSLEKYVGDKDTLNAVIAASTPPSLGQQAAKMLPVVGVDPNKVANDVAQTFVGPTSQQNPQEPQQYGQAKVAEAAPGILQAAAPAAGFGYSVGPKGISLRQNAPTQTEIGAVAGWRLLSQSAQGLVAQGIPESQAYQMAASGTVEAMVANGHVPPPEIRRLALAKTDSENAAARAGAEKHAQLVEQMRFEQPLAQEHATGETMGKANAQATIPFQSIHVPGPVGPNGEPGPDILIPYANASAYAATGNTKAVSLGKNPSKTQLDTASMEGADLIQGPGGELIKLPIGHEGNTGAVSAASVEQGPEARAKMDQISKALDDIVTPKFLKAFPSEKEMGRMTARSAGEWHSWTARFTDSPEVLLARGNLRKLAIPMTTLLGTGKRLSNQELANAMGPWQAIADGTATREQVVLAQQDSKKWLSLIDERTRKGETPGTNPAPTTAQPQAKTAAPAPDNDLAARLAKAVDAGGMTKEQAAQAYRAMTGVSGTSATPAP